MVKITYQINDGPLNEITDFVVEGSNLCVKKNFTPPDTSSSFDLELTISHNNVTKTRNFTCIKQYADMYFDPDNDDFYDNVLDMEISLEDFNEKIFITDYRVGIFVVLVCCVMYLF